MRQNGDVMGDTNTEAIMMTFAIKKTVPKAHVYYTIIRFDVSSLTLLGASCQLNACNYPRNTNEDRPIR